MKDRIVKIFTGNYIDLSHITSITQAFFDDGLTHDSGPGVEFEIHTILRDKPISFWLPVKQVYSVIEHPDGRKSPGLLMIDGSYKTLNWNNTIPDKFLNKEDYKNIKGVQDIQTKIDELIKVWKDFAARN